MSQAAALVVAVVLAVSACSSTVSAPPSTDVAASPTEASVEGVTEVDDPAANATLDELGDLSDLVVRGSVTDSQNDVQIGTDTTAKYTLYTVSVSETIRGEKAKSIKVAMMTKLDGGPVNVEGRANAKKGADAVWALTKIAPEFGVDGYVLTNTGSVLPVDATGKINSAGDTAAAKEAKALGDVAAVTEKLKQD